MGTLPIAIANEKPIAQQAESISKLLFAPHQGFHLHLGKKEKCSPLSSLHILAIVVHF